MTNDPHQLNNLAAEPNHAEIKAELASRLQLYLQQYGDPRQSGQTPWDNYPFTDFAVRCAVTSKASSKTQTGRRKGFLHR